MSGPDGHWYADEDDALQELPWGMQVMYLRGLRRFMARDGVVGLAKTISRQALIEVMTVPAKRGRHQSDQERPTVKTVRHGLDVLRSVGLIEPLPGYEGCLVFRLPLAMAGESVRRMRGRSGADPAEGMSGPTNPSSNAAPGDMKGRMRGRAKAAMRGPPQITEGFVDTTVSAESSVTQASARGALCKRLRDAGVVQVNPSHPSIVAAITDGLDIELVVRTAVELVSRQQHDPPPAAYVIAAVRGRMADAARAGNAAGSGSGTSVSERAEQALRDGDEREWREQQGGSMH